LEWPHCARLAGVAWFATGRVLKSRVLTKERFAQMYKVPEEDVLFFEHDAAKAIKISIPRPYVQGARDDGDAYGGQQHAPLVELEIPD
jgi:hypothetical protein